MNQSLLSKYAPKGLADIVGQSYAVDTLQSFVAAPFSTAFVFYGPTGVGKTCTAKAMASDLGCVPAEQELGGVNEIPSGKQDGQAVQNLLRGLRLRPLYGNGWKIAVVNEADFMTPQAEAIWLDGLENLPPKTVVIFTTNNLGKLSKRLIGRCEVIPFSGDSKELIDGMHELVRKIWVAETGHEPGKLPKDLGKFEPESETYSVRLAVQQIAPLIRAKASEPAAVHVPFGCPSQPAVRATRKAGDKRPAHVIDPNRKDNTLKRWKQKAEAMGLDWPRVHAMKAIVRSEDRDITPEECWEKALVRAKKEKVPA